MKPAGRRRKGSAGERELVAVLEAGGMPARKVPLSGAVSGFDGDVLVLLCGEVNHMHNNVCGPERRIEVKRRAQGFKRISAWLQDNYAVCYREDRGDWKITLRLADFLEAMK